MVHIGEISFCDKVAFNIKSDDTKKYLLDRLEKKYKLKIITKHFDRFEEKMMSTLNNNPHLLCVRSNGNPYFLYLTKFNFVNYCIFVDKKIQQGYFFPRMIITNFHFDDELFEDTILDGEMIKKNEDKWVFLLHDLIVYKGRYLLEQNLVKRINLLYEMLKKEFQPDIMDISRLQVKKFFRYDELHTFLNDHIPQLPYTCRGIYFKPLFLRFRDVLINFNDDLVKKVERNKFKHVKNFLLLEDVVNKHTSEQDTNMMQKTPSMTNNTRTFFVRKTSQPDVYEMYDVAQGNLVDTACVPSMRVSKFLRNIFMTKNMVDQVELVCELSEKFNKWVPMVS
jgi:hypothetical protein